MSIRYLRFDAERDVGKDMTIDSQNLRHEPGESPLRLVTERIDTAEKAGVDKQFVNFQFLRVGADWRRLDDKRKSDDKREFLSVFDTFLEDFLFYSYSLVGFDSKADLMFWRIARSLDVIQDSTVKMIQTNLGSYLETVDSYLSVTKRMMFVDGPADDRMRVQAGTAKYHFVYPCAKHNDWFEMAADERDAMIEENFMVGKKFPNIKIHLTHAFGFNDHEYLISFETDEPRDFIALAEELRHTPAGRLTLRGMPVYTCRRRSLTESLDALG